MNIKLIFLTIVTFFLNSLSELSCQDELNYIDIKCVKVNNQISIDSTEEELLKLITVINPEIRFLGEDYINRTDYTGYGLPPKIIFLKRDHGWSTTKFKNLIAGSIINNNTKEK